MRVLQQNPGNKLSDRIYKTVIFICMVRTTNKIVISKFLRPITCDNCQKCMRM